jgi:hypothetical protein
VSGLSFPAFFAQMRSEPVYVILGVQGSGTNLLRSILDPTFNFSVVQDQALVYNAALRLGQSPSAEAVRREFDGMLPRLLPTAIARKTLRRIKTNGSFEGIAAHFNPSVIASGTDLAYFVYAYSAYSRNSSLMAIKSDDLWETIAPIDAVLPNRRIILLTRDFRDNLLSITNKDFGPVDPLIAARYVKTRFAHYDREYRRTSDALRIHVRYEDLLDEPDAFVSRFRAHFGIGGAGDSVPPVNTGRIRRGNMKKWATIPAATLAHCEAVLHDELLAYGYQPECERPDAPGTLIWCRAEAWDAMKRVPQKLRALSRRLQK